jgi:hypothetical protein
VVLGAIKLENNLIRDEDLIADVAHPGDKFWLQGYLGNVFAVKQNSMVLFEVVETMLQIINDVVCDGH